nr:biotin/lipoate A/B protein ligase family protein [Kerstersia gyiorum]
MERSWRDYEWQLVEAGPMSPAMHLALDDVLGQAVGAGQRAPTLRFWEWSHPAIIIGCFQSLKNEVDMDAARRLGVDVVRRITGGGAMFVEPGSTITYSLYAPGELVRGMSFAESYAFLDDWVLKALNELGIAVLHHVTMAYDMDAGKMLQVLRIGREKLSDKGTASAAKRVDPLRSQTGLAREQIIARMKATFAALNGGTPGQITPEEFAAAESLAQGKFSSEAWLNHLP